MKKIALLLLLGLAAAVLNLETASSQSSVGVGLQIRDTFGPAIGLTHPLNNSGHFHENVTFYFNVSDASNLHNCSLIINSKINQTNKSILIKAPSINFFRVDNMSIGPYNWSINCTDNLDNKGASPERSFYVNSMKNFNPSFFNVSAFDMRNVSNFAIGTGSCNKINFSGNLDLTQGFDFDRHTNVSFNHMEINSSALPSLNISATITMCNLTFSNPRIAKDGVVCPDSICKKISYSGGILTFNVSHWTSYGAEETPGSGDSGGGSTGGGGGAGGGGGGGGGTPPAVPIITDFSIDKTNLKVVLKQGQTKTETLIIKNTGTTIFDITAYLSNIVQFKISPEEHELTTTLQPDEEKTIELVFMARENEIPDIYPAKIILKSPSKEKSIDTIIEVDSAEPLFDVDAEVLSESKKIFPGEELLMEINLFNVRGFGRVDVSVEYAIKDFKGNILATEHETLSVETQAKVTRSLLVPSDLVPGNYVALVKVTYADSVGTSSDVFEVKARAIRLSLVQLKDYRVVLLIGLAAVLAVFAFSAYKFGYLKKKAPKTKVEEVKILKDEGKAEKLRKELSALDSARKSGFMSEESYQRDKKRIEEKLSKLK